MRKFYDNLFKKKENLQIEDTALINIKDRLPKLKNIEKINIEKEITMDELNNIVKKS